MMDATGQSIYGRKAFFVNPPYLLERAVLAQLREQEYDAYIIKDLQMVMPVLRRNPNSILFVNVESVMDYDGWLNFITAVESEFPTVLTAVLSERIDATTRNMFLNNAALAGGFITFTGHNPQNIEGVLLESLELNGAKGRRRYIRANCTDDPHAAIEVPVPGGGQTMLKLLDISVVGVACVAPLEKGQMFIRNGIIRDATIFVGGKKIPCTLVVYASGRGGSQATIVMLFKKGMQSAAKTLIREYIFSILERQTISDIKDSELDTNDYSVGYASRFSRKKPASSGAAQ